MSSAACELAPEPGSAPPVAPVRFASGIDAFAFGEHRAATPTGRRRFGAFSGRITPDPTSRFPAARGRYHVYGGRFCPRSHRATITLALAGRTDQVSVSYVDGLRDARGWAFRPGTGPDPVNGFALLREAYEHTEPGYDGPVSIPVLWDRVTEQIVSTDPDHIDVDLATAFGPRSHPGVDLYPESDRGRIDGLSRSITSLGRTMTQAVYHDVARSDLRTALRDLDRRVGGNRFLLGDSITLADVRLWVLLVRYDAGPNANGAAGPALSTFPQLWAYARDLYARPAFRDTTDFDAFSAPFAPRPDWTQPALRPVTA